MGEAKRRRESFDDEILTEEGEMIDCPSCQGWEASETGMDCLLCGGDGVIWNPGRRHDEARVMAENTKIEWADHTFNPWVGCTKVSPACDHCYAEGWAKRAGSPQLWQGDRRRTSEANWQKPLKWNRNAERAGVRQRVFCASLADVFDNQVPARWRDDLWHWIERTAHLDWLLLTKRPQNIEKMLPDPATGVRPWGAGWPNVWLGTTAESQAEADRRIPILLETPATVRFLSAEPLLGPLDLTRVWTRMPGGGTSLWNALSRDVTAGIDVSIDGDRWPGGRPGTRLDWVITGGESGPGARPMNPQWARDIRDACRAAGVAYFHKQNGEWASVSEVEGPGEHREFPDGRRVRRVGKVRAGRLLDGREWNGTP